MLPVSNETINLIAICYQHYKLFIFVVTLYNLAEQITINNTKEILRNNVVKDILFFLANCNIGNKKEYILTTWCKT